MQWWFSLTEARRSEALISWTKRINYCNSFAPVVNDACCRYNRVVNVSLISDHQSRLLFNVTPASNNCAQRWMCNCPIRTWRHSLSQYRNSVSLSVHSAASIDNVGYYKKQQCNYALSLTQGLSLKSQCFWWTKGPFRWIQGTNQVVHRGHCLYNLL